VDIIREGFELFLRTGELTLENLDPHVEWHDPPDFPDKQVHYGREGAVAAISRWMSAWDEWTFEVEDYIDAGDSVVVLTRQRGRGKETGALVEQPMALIYKFRGGKAIRVQAYFDTVQALEAAGLSE
jgi:ketosteroid isomerase-like protein